MIRIGAEEKEAGAVVGEWIASDVGDAAACDQRLVVPVRKYSAGEAWEGKGRGIGCHAVAHAECGGRNRRSCVGVLQKQIRLLYAPTHVFAEDNIEALCAAEILEAGAEQADSRRLRIDDDVQR